MLRKVIDMFLIRFEINNELAVWDYDNKKDFETWLDKLTRWYDEKAVFRGYNITKIEICICRLWITIR